MKTVLVLEEEYESKSITLIFMFGIWFFFFLFRWKNKIKEMQLWASRGAINRVTTMPACMVIHSAAIDIKLIFRDAHNKYH